MNNPFDHIEEFLAGELSIKEHAQFEKALLKDSTLRDEVDMVREMELFAQRKVDNKEALDVVKNVMEEGKRMEEGKQQSSSFVRATILFVLMCLLGLAAWVLLSQKKPQINTEQLFAQHYQPEKASFSTKSNNNTEAPQFITADSILQLAEFSFNQENYNQSIQYFDQYHDLIDTLNPEAQYYKSIALLGNNEPVKAIQAFDRVSDNDSLFNNDIHWYKGLSYLKNDNYTLAREELLGISENSVRFKLGKDLLEELSELTKAQQN